MSSDQRFVDHVCGLASPTRPLVQKKMFGEYALYLDGKVIALVCDDQLFVKPTVDGRSLLATVDEQPPYPGAKPHFRIDAELEDRPLMQRLFDITARSLPAPRPKATRGARPAAATGAAKKRPSGKRRDG